MKIFSWLAKSGKDGRDAASNGAYDTGLDAIDWIMKETGADLELTRCGPLDTTEGQIVFLDPLAFFQAPEYTPVPASGSEIVVFHDKEQRRNSKLAIIFSQANVAGGADVGTCAVDAGMASIFTPKTHAAMTEFCKSLGPEANPYDDYFSKFDDPSGGERKIATLPDGAPVPYVHSGWGDGGYPVFALHDADGGVCAVYTDFMGRNDEDGTWVAPPGVVLN